MYGWQGVGVILAGQFSGLGWKGGGRRADAG